MYYSPTATAIYVVDPALQEVLLAIKGRSIGVGHRFPYGGKIKEGQTSLENICEELKDETGGKVVIVESEPILVGRICFYNGTNHEPHQCEPDYVVDFYYVEKSKAALGIPPSTDEMKEPAWFPFDPLPPNLKPGDELFMPQFLQKKVLHGYVHFHDNGQVLKSYLVECDPKCLELD